MISGGFINELSFLYLASGLIETSEDVYESSFVRGHLCRNRIAGHIHQGHYRFRTTATAWLIRHLHHPAFDCRKAWLGFLSV